MNKILSNIHLSDFPEKISITETSGGKIQVYMYGPKSYDNQLAVITHYLHNREFIKDFSVKQAHKYLREYLEYKFPKIEITEGVLCDPLQEGLFNDFFQIPFPDPKNYKFTFIDLFAGMGGFRLAMQAQGGKCIFSSEWNPFAQKTYMANFGEMPFGDITKEETKRYIPEHFDVLCAGFPCQPFSIAGVSKKKSLGRETGFRDKTQGTLFFDVAEILSRHRPKAFYLENVKNLVSHDKGNTFKIICSTLEELEYSIHYKVMDGKDYVPQHRERIMIVGFDKRRYHGLEHFEFPKADNPIRKIRDILDYYPDSKYTLSDKLWNYLQNYAEKHKAKGNGFGFGLVDLDGISRTLSARYYKDGSEILIPQGDGINPRRLTPRECARLMGYPDEYIINKVSDVQAYRQCGNSVVVPLITAVSEQLVKTMLNTQIYE
ncbi:DNA (cytosine-5-)-methyltransferase [Bacteroides mediterraneensis]|uniref:DNA (cytosine-5-)-methyltransferase n=1 Tax=Bacteroides mediterraneensis TaxID=1841856 RepID=UPI00093321C7|nr:DNA (cytosine-5-)-methyltransferase [Bacteroides mediterraneensis]